MTFYRIAHFGTEYYPFCTGYRILYPIGFGFDFFVADGYDNEESVSSPEENSLGVRATMAKQKRPQEEAPPQIDEAVLQPFLDELRQATDEQLRSNFIRKHIITGDPARIDRDTYFDLRRRVSAEFNVHPSAVVIVGSCKLGFTLKQKGPHQGPKYRYAECSSASDVDIAVVSQGLFDEIWDAVFHTVYPKREWPVDIGRQFSRDLFNGWIDPTKLPNTPRYARAVSWSRFFAGLSRDRVCGMRAINGRLYRTWGRLEAYQDHMVRECLTELQQGVA